MHDQFASLTVSLLEGAYETPLWSSFLEELRLSVGADYATLILQSPLGPFEQSLYSIAGNASIDEARETFRRYRYPDNPERRVWAQDGKPYGLAEILKFDGAKFPDFIAELTTTIGINAVREMRVQEPSGIDAWLSVVRDGAEFGDDVTRLFTEIAPVLRGVLRNYVTVEQHRFAAEAAGDVVRRLQFGWIALDASGLVIEADRFGEHVLATSGVLRRDRQGKIALRRSALQRELEQAVAGIAAGQSQRPRAIPLRTDPWLDMLLVPARHRPLAAAGTATVIAYVHGDNWSSSDREVQLAELFSLSRSEARLALALCRGKTIAEAAGEFGLTVDSARTYSKSIFAKTGARGQPDLVRIIMGSILALSPEA
ncbi:MAG: helix-turn-helix transcriptional regulator [Novosphingobium sp.]